MPDQATIDGYLEDIDAHLRTDRARRRRFLDEIDGHLRDAVDAHVARGIPPQQAVQLAIDELGPPQEVAQQLAPTPPPARALRGWRRWAPLVLPSVALAVAVFATAWHALDLRDGTTRGLELVLRDDLLHVAMVGGLAAATAVAIRSADHDPRWRGAVWFVAALTVVVATIGLR